MKGYHANIEDETKDNNNFRKVLYTGENSQLVVMSLKPGEDIGLETHHHIDQFIRVEEGEGEAVIDDQTFPIKEDEAIIIPAGSEHNVTNTAETELKLYTIYSPPEHPEGTIHHSKSEAVEHEHHH